MAAPHESIVLDYARDTVDSPDACLDTQAAARRYLADLRNPMWNFRTGMAEAIIEIIESLFCHQQGEDLLGRPLRGKPLILEPFQLFVIYNVCGFFYPGTDLRRFQEVLAMLARKNGKTPFATSFCWAVGLWYARSFSKIKTVSGSMKQNIRDRKSDPKRKGKTNAEVAFVLEYGSPRHNATHFMEECVEASTPEVIAAMEAEFSKLMDERGL